MSVLSKSFYSILASALLISPLLVSASSDNDDNKTQKAPIHWSYQGDTGPIHWAELSSEFLTCKQGKNQSPENISRAVKAKLKPIAFDYAMLVPENIVNTGHSIQVNIRSGGSIKFDDKEFFLKQFHFHSPSENQIDGVSYPLEAHFVHVSDDNELAVVSLLYQPGLDNLALLPLLKNMPMKVGGSSRLSAQDTQLFERKKAVKNYFRYNGSLTTPPCTEGVTWIVMQSRPGMSQRQLNVFRTALQHPNSRPVQPLNARTVLK
ncbi:carbonic anhydrase [sulfur-oxidizing endosymbiont of Gigantopelta aegis]|uniref:carbonic anhydrase n=1 Tax=sulfur-oxidizing endosymbiont of Gigantopelta aegis TaxID=2794934 RepID=UPI0018DB4287|nr:carbonic anhydrase family protein [sulfur-oxidizing endosymbiont of Gigantopelta aegis]